MYYDTQVIYNTQKEDYKGFTWGKYYYYQTSTGRTKRRDIDGKIEKVTKESYDKVWNEYKRVFK